MHSNLYYNGIKRTICVKLRDFIKNNDSTLIFSLINDIEMLNRQQNADPSIQQLPNTLRHITQFKNIPSQQCYLNSNLQTMDSFINNSQSNEAVHQLLFMLDPVAEEIKRLRNENNRLILLLQDRDNEISQLNRMERTICTTGELVREIGINVESIAERN
jgi:hypothetical protein